MSEKVHFMDKEFQPILDKWKEDPIENFFYGYESAEPEFHQHNMKILKKLESITTLNVREYLRNLSWALPVQIKGFSKVNNSLSPWGAEKRYNPQWMEFRKDPPISVHIEVSLIKDELPICSRYGIERAISWSSGVTQHNNGVTEKTHFLGHYGHVKTFYTQHGIRLHGQAKVSLLFEASRDEVFQELRQTTIHVQRFQD